MSGVRWPKVARAFRRVALPLASYYGVTLAVPVANGAASSTAFMEHALFVLVIPPMAIILGCAVHTIARALARHPSPEVVDHHQVGSSADEPGIKNRLAIR